MLISKAFPKPCQISEIDEYFVKIFDLQPLTIFSKLSILDVQQGSGHTSENIGNSRKSILNWLLQGERLRLLYTLRKVNLRIQFEYRKIRTRKNPYLDTFHAVWYILMKVFKKTWIENLTKSLRKAEKKRLLQTTCQGVLNYYKKHELNIRIEPIRSQCTLSLRPENIRKLLRFSVFRR